MRLFSRKEVLASHNETADAIRIKSDTAAKALAIRVQKINDLDAEYDVKKKEKEQELLVARTRLKTFATQEEQLIRVLEERRLAALKPIVQETQELGALKVDVQAAITALEGEQEAIRQTRMKLHEEENRVRVEIAGIEKLRSEVSAMLDRKQKDADTAVEAAKIAMVQMQKEQEVTQSECASLDERIASFKRAEMSAKAAMIAADQKILLEQREQKKTDEKRKMLALAIGELKKRGLWQKKQYGTVIK